jgi:hypothetical protein
MEAIALPSLGMRDGAFTLNLDIKCIPENRRHIYKRAERNAFFQAAYERCMSGPINTTQE